MYTWYVLVYKIGLKLATAGAVRIFRSRCYPDYVTLGYRKLGFWITCVPIN